MPLTDTAIRTAKPREKTYKLADERGLYLEVAPSGGKWWRLKYRFGGKERRLSLGTYPDVGLKVARERRDNARKLLADGLDPSEERRQAKRAAEVAASNSFETVARSWWEKWKAARTAGTADAAIRALERNVFPFIGKKAITAIQPPDILDLLRKIEARGATDMLKRVRARIGEVYIFAIANGLATTNPAEGLHKAVTPHIEERRPALRATELRDFFIKLDVVRISAPVKTAIRLLALTFVRPGELRCAQWPEFDLDSATWTVPAERDRSRGLTGMKMREEHVVPLSRQAVALLREMQARDGGADLLFPNRNGQGRPISDNTINKALRAMGYASEQVTGAGFRATATGALLELGFRPDIIDKQLAHKERKQVFAAYSHQAQFMAERRQMMQAWADYLDQICKDGNVVPIRRDAA